MTTISYIVRKMAVAKAEEEALKWLMDSFEIVPADAAVFRQAMSLGISDYEDAVVAASAETSKCDYIVTRNIADFAKSSIPAIQPAEFLAMT